MSSDVATSISCRDITLCPCLFQLVAPGVVTSVFCRDITLWLCRFHLLVPDVATSIPCRDIGSKNCNFQLCMSDVTTSFPCHDINSCRDLMMLSRRHSLSFWLLFTCLSGTSYCDLHKTPSMILMSRTLNLDCVSQKLHQ